MVMSSSRWIVWCAATMMPGRQWMPLAGMRRRAWIATTDCPARSTAPARSLERIEDAAGWWRGG
jgi:hypothetical protein